MIRLRLLGECVIEVADVPVGPESQVLFATLLYLATERGRRVGRATLHALLWPDAGEDAGRHNLRQTLYKLRQMGVPLDSTQSSVLLRAELVTGEATALADGAPAPLARLDRGRRLMEYLPGYAPTFSAPFADWVEEQRGIVHAQLRRGLLASLADARQRGAWPEVEVVAQELLRCDALNEEATLALAEAAALSGGKAQALGILDRYLTEIGGDAGDIRLPATVLRRRIAERIPASRYMSAADRCFVGRAGSVALLTGMYQRARQGRGAAVLVWGEPGIGKTRLTQEVERMVTLQGTQVQRVGCQAWDVQRPLSIFMDMVPGLRALPGALGVAPESTVFLDRLTHHDGSPPSADLPSPSVLQGQVRRAVVDLFEAITGEVALLLVVEDVHWLDAASWRLLQDVARAMARQRFLLVLTSRESHLVPPPGVPAWEGLARHHLTGLDDEAANRLLDTITRESGRIPTLEYREWCLPMVAGNPLHLQEVALQWVERGESRDAPIRIRASIENRVHRISPGSLRLLQALSLARPSRPNDIATRALELRPGEHLDAIEELANTGLVTSAEGTLRPRHPVIAEIAEGTMSAATTAQLHRAIARAYIVEWPSVEDISATWERAYHLVQANDREAAVKSLAQCAAHCSSIGQPASAIELLQHAIALTGDEDAREWLSEQLALAFEASGDWSSVARVLRRADNALPASEHVRARTHAKFVEAEWRLSLIAGESIERTTAVALDKTASPAERLRCAYWALVIADNRADWATMRTVFAGTREIQEDSTLPAAQRRLLQMVWHTNAGDILSAGAIAGELAEMRSLGLDVGDHCTALRAVAQTMRAAVSEHAALDVYQRALTLAQKAHLRSAQLSTIQGLASMSTSLGDIDDASYWCARAEEFSDIDDAVTQIGIRNIRVKLAIARENVPVALSLLTDSDWDSPCDPVVRRRATLLQLLVRLQTLDSQVRPHAAAHLLDRLAADFDILREHGLQDYAASSIASAYLRAGHRDRARVLVADYMQCRRERTPPASDLCTTAAEIELTI